jgi:ABC-type Zn uptake system ZnuABC Zn-binding protein ZnuA
VVTVFPIYDLARRVAGPDADVVLLVAPGKTPHGFVAGPEALAQVKGARLGVLVGGDLDGWLETALKNEPAPAPRILKLADRVPNLPRMSATRDAADPSGAVDVHVWLDPSRAAMMERAITDALSRVDSAHASAYRARGLEVSRALEALDETILKRTAEWKARGFVTLHDAFRYYAEHYHLEVVGALEPTPGTAPTAREKAALLARVSSRAVGGVFGEPQLASEPAKAFAASAHLAYGTLDPLGGTPGLDSYEAVLLAVTDGLEKALLAPATDVTR